MVVIEKLPQALRHFIPSIDIPEEHHAWIRGNQLSAFKKLLPYGLVASALNCLVIILVFMNSQNTPAIWVWTGIMSVIAVSGLPAGLKAARSSKKVKECGSSALSAPTSASLVLGLGWGLGPVLLAPTMTANQEMVVAIVCAGMMCGGAYVLSTVPRAAVGFIGMIAAGLVAGLLIQGGVHNWALVAVLGVYTAIMITCALWNYSNYVQNWLQQVELRQKSDVISLLLKDFEDTASDCLWETDEKYCFNNVSQALAGRTGLPISKLEGISIFEVLGDEEDQGLGKLRLAMEKQAAFRDIVVPLAVGGKTLLWSMAGKPVFKHGRHVGYRGVCADVTAARNAESRISYLAHFDSVTDLPNRLSFREALERALYQHQLNGDEFAVFCLDLDYFKTINDIHGHPFGDAVLLLAAQRMRSCVGANDMVARLGGDEFVVLQRETKDRQATMRVAENLLVRMSQPFDVDGVAIQSGVSIGIALCPQDSTHPNELYKNADLALHRAKRAGRGQAFFFDAEMDAQVSERRKMESDLRLALETGQFRLYYQPLVDSQTKQTNAFETLLRWNHPEKGIVSPEQFVSLAEDTGMIVPIGEWVIREAFSEAANWPEHVSVSVNLSPRQIKCPNLIPTLVNALAQSGLAAGRAEMEITESVLLDDSPDCMRTLHAIRDLGIRISLDDFGTGYSSLSYLQRFPFDKIKIDRSFVSMIGESAECRAIIKSIVGLAHDLGMRTTAEGVESEGQLSAVVTEGCSELQGFYFSKPKSATDLYAAGIMQRNPISVADKQNDGNLVFEAHESRKKLKYATG